MKKLLDSLSVLRYLSPQIGSLAVICAWHCIVGPAFGVAASQQTSPTDPVRSAVVTAVTSEIVIDGSLDEAPWRQAPKIGDLVQRIPVAGAVPTERTEVTLLYDNDNLYIGVMCYDAEPRRVLASQMARDASLNGDDRLGIVLDTFRDQSNAFHFATNRPAPWSTVWCLRTVRRMTTGTASGSCEPRARTKGERGIAIPFKT